MYFQDPDQLKFSKTHQETLRRLTIDASESATVLHDFEAILDLVKAGSLEITPAGQLTLASVSTINSRMSHPLQLGLQRPQQKSYPHVHGLYLLLRASGLTTINETEKRRLLYLEDALYQQWLALNPTERYCTLLETWMIRGKPEIIGEYGRSFDLIPDNFERTASFYIAIPSVGARINNQKTREAELAYHPGLYNLGLLDLFGLVNVEQGSSEPGRGWCINAIYRTPVGDAFIAALYTGFFSDPDSMLALEDNIPESLGVLQFGVLQPILQPYLAGWRNNLVGPKGAFRLGTYVFKVALGKVWRQIGIDAHLSLDDLASIILMAFEFDDDHLYEFSYKNPLGITVSFYHTYMDEGPFAEDVKIGDLPIAIGQTIKFLFDFGDNWKFTIVLEQINTKQLPNDRQILATYGTPPLHYPNWDEDEP